MNKLISIIIFLIAFSSYAQNSSLDWKRMDKSTLLIDWVKNQAYEYLDFEPNGKDSVANNKVRISHRATNSKIIIRDSSQPRTPLIIINQYPLENWNVLYFISLGKIDKMDLYRPSKTLSGIYGTMGKYGLINIVMNERKWKKLKRKYGR